MSGQGKTCLLCTEKDHAVMHDLHLLKRCGYRYGMKTGTILS